MEMNLVEGSCWIWRFGEIATSGSGARRVQKTLVNKTEEKVIFRWLFGTVFLRLVVKYIV